MCLNNDFMEDKKYEISRNGSNCYQTLITDGVAQIIIGLYAELKGCTNLGFQVIPGRVVGGRVTLRKEI